MNIYVQLIKYSSLLNLRTMIWLRMRMIADREDIKSVAETARWNLQFEDNTEVKGSILWVTVEK